MKQEKGNSILEANLTVCFNEDVGRTMSRRPVLYPVPHVMKKEGTILLATPWLGHIHPPAAPDQSYGDHGLLRL